MKSNQSRPVLTAVLAAFLLTTAGRPLARPTPAAAADAPPAAGRPGDAAGRLTVAILPPVLAHGHAKHAGRAGDLVDAVQAALSADPGLRLVERAEVRRVLDEQHRVLALGTAESVAVGRGVGADLLVQPQFVLDKEGWSLRLNVVDPEKADHLGASVTKLPGDRQTGPAAAPPEAWVTAVGARLRLVGRQLPELRARTAVGLLFFANRSESGNRLDAFAAGLPGAVAAAAGGRPTPALRMLRFGAVEPARGEQQLALAGVTAGVDRWQDVARWWVWGEVREADWENKPFEAAGVVVRANVWDGAHEPAVVEERGTVGELRALAGRVADRVTTVASAPVAGPPLPADRLAGRLLAEARATTVAGAEGSTNATPAWLARWRQACLLLDLARFLAPDDRGAALEWLRTRFREDMSMAVAPADGTGSLAEPADLWHLRRAAAWGAFGDRFGLADAWPGSWPGGPGYRTDNRTAYRSAAGMYLSSAAGLVAGFAEHPYQSRFGGDRWGADPADRAAGRRRWAAELDRRLGVVNAAAARAAAGGGATAGGAPAADVDAVAGIVGRAVDHLADAPDAAKRLLSAVVGRPDVAAMKNPRWVAATIDRVGNAAADPGWARQLSARLPPQPPPAPSPTTTSSHVLRPAAARPPAATRPTAAVAAAAGVDLTARYDVTVSAVAAWQGAWLVAADGTDLNVPGMEVGTFVFQRKPAFTPAGFARIDKGIMMPAGVTAVAQHESLVWMVSGGSGIAQIDLLTSRWKHWGLTSGLPVDAFADVDLDPDRVPFAVSGDDVSPPVLVYRPADRWLTVKVPTFAAAAEARWTPSARRVAASRRAAVVAGGHHGVAPFASLWRRDHNDWVDLRAALLRHLADLNLDPKRVTLGAERFNVLDAVALPAGGFILVHGVGATWVDDDGVPQRTVEWADGQQFAKFGQCLPSRDGSRVWVAGTVEPAGGPGARGMAEGKPAVIELRVAPGAAPATFDVPATLRTPLRLAEDGDRLLVGGDGGRPHVTSLPLRDGSLAAPP
jgi:hypothetical protein